MKSELEALQKEQFTNVVKDRIKELKLKLEGELDKEELMWKQRSNNQRLVEGDRNTKILPFESVSRSKY